MIIKGKSRAGAGQLARHLLNAEQNEQVKILANDYGIDYDLQNTFSDMQALTELTKGKLGLYHANIDPDARYEMTPEQFIEAADVLEKELGFEGQSRVIVLHEKKGRTHVHVVWSRVDMETRTLKSDSNNYLKHERASMECEQRFGHEHVPGVHAKKDPEQERPVAQFDHAAWQQAERTGVDPRERKKQVTALYQQADNGQAFVAALEQNGYVLAQGKKRGFVIVDQVGEIHSLARQVDDKSVNAKALTRYLSHLDPAHLPDADQVKTEIKARNAEQEHVNEPHDPKHPNSATPHQSDISSDQALDQSTDPATEGGHWDRDQYHQHWNDQLAESAIAQAEANTEKPDVQAGLDNTPDQKPSWTEKRLAKTQKRLDASVKWLQQMDRRAEVLEYRKNEFEAAFGTVFRDSEKAYKRFRAAESRTGFRSAMSLLEKDPKRFGKLNGSALLFADKNRRAARKNLPKLAKQAIMVRGLEKKVLQDQRERPSLNARIVRQTYKRDQLLERVNTQTRKQVSPSESRDTVIADNRVAEPNREQETGATGQAFNDAAPANTPERIWHEKLIAAARKEKLRTEREAQRQRGRDKDWERTL